MDVGLCFSATRHTRFSDDLKPHLRLQLPAVNQHGGGQGGGGEGGQQDEVAADSVQSAAVEQQFLKSL